MTENDYILASLFLEGWGPMSLRRIYSYFGSFTEAFETPKRALLQVEGIGKKLSDSFQLTTLVLDRFEEEKKFCEKHGISVVTWNDEAYPIKLKQCPDAPPLLFVKGNVELLSRTSLAIIGTRKPKLETQKLVGSFMGEFASSKLNIVSGLALGVDSLAHKAALTNNLSTVGIVAHGLDTLYPSQNRNLVKEILSSGRGALVTELPSKTKLNPKHFPRRNRIVAGISGATLVMESLVKGGSMTTAKYAFDYNREVFAVPSAINKEGNGCNALIKRNLAQLVENGTEVLEFMGWMPEKIEAKEKQQKLSLELGGIYKQVFDVLNEKPLGLDRLSIEIGVTTGVLAPVLLTMEMENYILRLPGNCFITV
jgi:DNA processing protein